VLKVVELAQVRALKELDCQDIQKELLAFAQESQFPGGQMIDQGTQEPTLDEEAESILLRMFAIFGVIDLNPLDPDFDLVCNTWYELTKVGASLRSKHLFKDTLFKAQRKIWHPAYAAYVDALWSGNVEAITRCAYALNIHRGIPETAPRLRDGPIPH
jgi:hypothetical protein